MFSWVITSCCALAALSAVIFGVVYVRTIRRIGFLAPVRDSADRPCIDVIVPARNEAADLESTVHGLLAQEDVDLNILIVNDHSSDATPAIADRLAAEGSRVSVLHNPALQPGWFGKVNAMQQGANLATAPDVLFCDADSKMEPRCLITAWRDREESKAALLSLCPLWVCESFWENALLPHCFVIGTVRFMPPSVNDDRSTHAVAAGAFILLKRDVFQAIGGFEAIKTEMLDDVELARHVKGSGYRTRFRMAPSFLAVRLFKSNSDAFWGLTKNIRGSVRSKLMAFPAVLVPVVFFWSPFVCLGWGLIQQSLPFVAVGLSTYVTQLWMTWLSTRLCRIRWVKAIFFPLSVLPLTCCYVSALYLWWFRGAVSWRGRVITTKPSS